MNIKNIEQNKLLFFGIKEGKLKHISEVENGLECNCVCPACSNILIAKNLGKIRVKHFAHSGNECKFGSQTAVHIAAKEILEKIKKIRVPEIKVFWNQDQLNGNYSFVPFNKYYNVTEKQYINIDSVILEKKLHDFIPDVVIISNDIKIIIEIAVTHFVGREKLEKIVNSNISTIEIDLSQYKNSFDYNELENMIIENIDKKNWLYSYPEEAMNNTNRQSNKSNLFEKEILKGKKNKFSYEDLEKIDEIRAKNEIVTKKKEMDIWKKEMDWNNDIEWD